MTKTKKLATLCLASLFTLSAGALLASCDDKKTEYNKEYYTFILKDEDGKALSGLNVQLCTDSGACASPVTSNASGKVEYTVCPWGEGEFAIHVWDATMVTEYEFEGNKKTPASYAEITLIVDING